MGEAHCVRYDYQALEKHILDKFIYGKPIILSDIPQVVYLKDIYTTVTFDAVRKNVSPQVSYTISILFGEPGLQQLTGSSRLATMTQFY